MTANDLYHDLILQGFSLSVNGERLTLSPSSQLTDDLRAKIRTYKAGLMALLVTSYHALKSEVKPVIQETVRQLDEVSTNGVNLKPTTDNLASEMQEVFPSSTHCPKNAVENVSPHIEDGQLPPMEEVNAAFGVRYAHLIKCQRCEHLTSTGYCRVKPQYKPMPEAMRDCASFGALKSDRTSEVRNEPYTQSELNALLSDCEKKLFHHFVKGCDGCSFMESRYCVDAFAIGSSYDAILLVFDDSASKRDALLNTVIRARISGRKVFVGIDYTNMGEPPQQTVKPLVYGIGDSERLFVNHLMTCEKCKPVSRTYCDEGLKLKADADSNYQS
jgi:hypothetical protein